MRQRLTVIGGAFGSGKTEFAIAYALKLKEQAEEAVGLIDLDIVNPYFRTRDQAAPLTNSGINVISSQTGLEHSDLPALSPRIFGFLQDKSMRVVFDLGGDPAGARALGRFNPYFQNESYDFWVVVNPFRPNTRNTGEIERLLRGLEENCRLSATGIVANINLGRETTISIWEAGLTTINAIGRFLRLPIVYQMVEASFYEANKSYFAGYAEIFPVTLVMLPPWLQE
ncbi:MAG: hypothetical protein K6U80_15455 [Firmicutes bacterium]|nr:hypothetical protein [Bacillota bacterium]